MAKTALERTIDFDGENNVSQNSVIRFWEQIGDLQSHTFTRKRGVSAQGSCNAFTHHWSSGENRSALWRVSTDADIVLRYLIE